MKAKGGKSMSFFRQVKISFMLAAICLPVVALAIAPSDNTPTLPGVADQSLNVRPSTVRFEVGSPQAAERAELRGFFQRHGNQWEVRWDQRGNRPNLVQGHGVSVFPGRGNGLQGAAVRSLPEAAQKMRGFMNEFPEMFGVDQADLQLHEETSRSFKNYYWTIEFQQTYQGVPVEGAKVFFRVNHGNIVQFGSERIGPIHINATPRLTAAEAMQRVMDETGLTLERLASMSNPGTLKIYPKMLPAEAAGRRFTGHPGQGYQHVLVWEIDFRVAGDIASYNALVDARNGRLLLLGDKNRYSTVRGGVYPTTYYGETEEIRPFPYTTVTNNGTKITDADGNYTYTGGTATAELDGRYTNINDNCGSISLSDSSTGDLDFGTSGGTDCTTPGIGGAGNTHSARMGMYHLTNINRKAATYDPSNSWLDGTLTANMNINNTCNAFWSSPTVNFYRSGGGCGNTGEIAAVFLHEWGHGYDANTGGSSDEGSGEALGDTFAFLETKDSCIGMGFFSDGSDCFNCTNCSGVRDVGDFDIDGPAVTSHPTTVEDNAGINCDRWSCPYFQFIWPYQGPMGYEGHCESYIASSANWDLTEMLIAEHGDPAGWQIMDSIWYGSIYPAQDAYQVVSGGQCNPSATIDGCGSDNWYTVYLSVDDDDGNLANGTPNGCRIWDAFNAHGIACGSRPACSGGCVVTEDPEVSCSDGVDNDCDGYTDGADPDCGGCVPTEDPEVSCSDGVDNDCDGLTDGADPDCTACVPTEDPEVSCSDGIDNDCDDLIDGDDPDCQTSCSAFKEPCSSDADCCTGLTCHPKKGWCK
jgi:hypothetical protein